MSLICSGFHVLQRGTEIVPNVFAVLLDDLRAQAELVLNMPWDAIVAAGYEIKRTEVWEL